MAVAFDMKAVLGAMKAIGPEGETFLVHPDDFTKLVMRVPPSPEMDRTFAGFRIVTDDRMSIGGMEFRSSLLVTPGVAMKLPRQSMFEFQQRMDIDMMRAIRGERIRPKPWTDDMRQMLDDIAAARWRR